jgi:hypothetical protein
MEAQIYINGIDTGLRGYPMEKAQYTANSSATIGATSSAILSERSGRLKRTQFIIINTSAAAVATITKGDQPAVANTGIILQPNASYLESTDSGFICWSGALQAIGTAAGTLSIVETFQQE